MLIVTIGILLFAGTHLFSILFSAVRDRLKAWIGEPRYKGAYSLISLIGLVLMGWGYVITRNDGIYAYQPVVGAKHITLLMVFVGFILIASNKGKGHIRKWVKHPFSIGISLWALGHLLASGKVPVMMMAATVLVISVFDIVFSLRREEPQVFEPVWSRDVKALVFGTLAYLVFLLGFHPYILGVPIVG